MRQLSKKEIDALFVLLSDCLGKVKLISESGEYRHVKCDEFMFMGIKDDYAQFKHRETRNYVFLQDQCLIVPREKDKPYLHGEF